MLDIGVLAQGEACTTANILNFGWFSVIEDSARIIDRFRDTGILVKIEGTRSAYNFEKVKNAVKRVHYNSFDKYLKDENIVLSQLHYNLCKEIWLVAKMS